MTSSPETNNRTGTDMSSVTIKNVRKNYGNLEVVHGIDLTLNFSRGEAIVAANTRLRSNLAHLTADPYGLGWLFAVRTPATPSFPFPPIPTGHFTAFPRPTLARHSVFTVVR